MPIIIKMDLYRQSEYFDLVKKHDKKLISLKINKGICSFCEYIMVKDTHGL